MTKFNPCPDGARAWNALRPVGDVDKENNDKRACLDCGEPGAPLWRTTKGENPGQFLRICAACLRKDDWHRFGLRQPFLDEVPTELVDSKWIFPLAEGPPPSAVITYTDEPSPETGDVGWCWWANGSMGCAPTYEDACRAAEKRLRTSRKKMEFKDCQ